MYKPFIEYNNKTIAFYRTVEDWNYDREREAASYDGPVDAGVVPSICLISNWLAPNTWTVIPEYEKLKIQLVDDKYIKVYGAEEYDLDESLFKYFYDVDIPSSERLDYKSKMEYVITRFPNLLEGEIKFLPLSEWDANHSKAKPKSKKEMVVRPFSNVPYAPNLLYTVIRNDSQLCSCVKPGYKIRLPNVPGSCTLCYWKDDDLYTECYQIAKSMRPENWQDKILVEFDDAEVRRLLIANAEDAIKHYENEKKEAEKIISENKNRIAELKKGVAI